MIADHGPPSSRRSRRRHSGDPPLRRLDGPAGAGDVPDDRRRLGRRPGDLDPRRSDGGSAALAYDSRRQVLSIPL
ncbi:hypothetical protein HBB16_16600 [Pseudonocardia sp. MCCB 268]|nr:hypothetical protein [Pseudonocardia cytotoxica]